MRPPVPFKPIRNHHSYYGVFLAAFGIFNYLMMIGSNELLELSNMWITFIIIGILMIADDVIEHNITADTPLRILFEKILLPIIKR